MATSQLPSSSIAPSNAPTSDLYKTALDRLAQLQSNRAITSLFDSPTPKSEKDGIDKDKKKDLNALAIPEMLAWLKRAGYTPESLTEAGLRCVHVAGTKGKGSVSALIASILKQYVSPRVSAGDVKVEKMQGGEIKKEEDEGQQQASIRGEETDSQHGDGGGMKTERKGGVGLYTSPHVLSVRERIILNNSLIPREKFGKYVLEIWDRLTQAARQEATLKGVEISEAELDGPSTKPFYFRFLTIVALHTFVSEGIRDAVIECGIGGEYDSTNILPAEIVTAAVVTQLGIDHVGMLGDTVEKIAWHKSGVFKKGVKGFTRGLPAEQSGVMEVLRARAREKGAELVEVGDEEVERWEGVEGARLQGPFQKYNMALAVYAAREHLLRTGVKLEGRFGTEEWSLSDTPAESLEGLKEASLRGRGEVLTDEYGVEWRLDGAHTEDSLAGVGRWFADRTNENTVQILVFNQQERDPSPLVRALLSGQKQLFHHAIFTRNEEQALPGPGPDDLTVQNQAARTMREVDEPISMIRVSNAVQPTVEMVRQIAAEAQKYGKQCKVLVTGSFHLVGAVLKTIEHVE